MSKVAKRETQEIATTTPANMAEIIRENLGDDGINPMDLERVRVPAGGGKSWTLPDGEDTKAIDGVIVGWTDARAYWPDSIETTGGGSPPSCTSPDSRTGNGDPGGDCRSCPFAQYGSAMKGGEPGRGQACKQMRLLFVQSPAAILPTLVVVPPSSLKAIKRYMLQLVSKGRPFWSVVTRLELEQAQNKGGITYSAVKPLVLHELEPELVDENLSIKRGLEPLIKTVTVVAEDAEV